MENWQLTEYEIERLPQAINMNSDMTISPRSLYREIVCPICLDIISQTRTAPDCLHRFCKKCLERVVKKDCPVCGKKLPSKIKSFREDAKFDQLLKKISEGYETSLKPLDVHKGAIVPDCEIVLRHLNGQQTRYLKCPENTTVDHLARYLAIRPEGSQGPKLESDEEYKLCIVANRSTGHYQLLSGTLKLEDVRNNYRLNTEQRLELYYYNP